MRRKTISATAGLVTAALCTFIYPGLWPLTIPLAALSIANLRTAIKGPHP